MKSESKEAKSAWPVNLPKTAFPMKGDLPQREPLWQAFWKERDIYRKMLLRSAGRPAYVLHDGPPYANGHIHIGHALNKILKDMTVKAQSLLGRRAPYIPGWDCHGLPIETALLKEMKAHHRKAVSDIPEFRRRATVFAQNFIEVQRGEFERLGCLGDWENPYRTMSPEYESKILRAFRLLYGKGYIYRGKKSVSWCVYCETALAEAEIEYKNKASASIYVAFKILYPRGDLSGAEVLIWTTTPWTLPANMGVAFHPDLEYVLVSAEVGGKPRKLLLAKARLEPCMAAIGTAGAKILKSWKGSELAPAAGEGEGRLSFKYEGPIGTDHGGNQGTGVLADYVTAEDGTGIVHTAPGHGPDDFRTGLAYGWEPILCPVDGAGRFTAEVPDYLRGKRIFEEGNPAVLEALKNNESLLSQTKIEHSYPHCWRCKNPIAFRATEQWFLNVGHEGLRERLLHAVGEVEWVPPEGKSRISAMLQSRPDWCISRQRVWGTPIPILSCDCRKYLDSDEVLKALEEETAKRGAGFWFENWGRKVLAPGSKGDGVEWTFLPKGIKCASCQGTEFARETDILDVWVDSGASWLGVLEEGQRPCDLYLEGSDQHRGWFQSSLVLSVAIDGRAPYKAVLTHGFVLDAHGRAMHKSSGNVVSPQEVIGKLGADVLRLWVAFADYADDVRISDKLLEVPTEAYRRVRNTLRYLLGNLADYDGSRPAQLPELERWVLHRLAELQAAVLEDYRRFRYRLAARALVDFCAADLSAHYLDVLKDRLYTFAPNDPERRAAQWVMREVLARLLRMISPILSFTAEEAWQEFRKLEPSRPESVFLEDLEAPDPAWRDPALAAKWEKVQAVREAALKALEEARAARRIGSSLQAKVVLSGGETGNLKLLAWPEILLVSGAEVLGGGGDLKVEVLAADGNKCPRCWRWQSDIGSAASHPELCGRCARHLSHG